MEIEEQYAFFQLDIGYKILTVTNILKTCRYLKKNITN